MAGYAAKTSCKGNPMMKRIHNWKPKESQAREGAGMGAWVLARIVEQSKSACWTQYSTAAKRVSVACLSAICSTQTRWGRTMMSAMENSPKRYGPDNSPNSWFFVASILSRNPATSASAALSKSFVKTFVRGDGVESTL